MLNELFQPVKYYVDKLPVADFCTYNKRSLSEIDYVIVHQTDDRCEENTPEDIAEYHITGRDFCGIGYHYYIEDKGKVLQVNDLETVSYHASGYNENGVGVVICGEHRLDECSIDDKHSNWDLVPKRQYNAILGTILKIERKVGKKLEILGHGETELTTKSCPNLDMDELRADVEKKRKARIGELTIMITTLLALCIFGLSKIIRRK